MSDDLDLCYLTAREALAAFRSRTLSPVEVMRATIARCEDVNPRLNAITDRFFEEAMRKAGEAEGRFMRPEGSSLPLDGLPLAVKDFHPVKDCVTTYGSNIFKNHRSSYTAATVQRLLDAGAIMHVRSTTPEFAYSGKTQSPLWGVTRNPWNTDFAPGGSSGGAGALIASGMSMLADGTDGGGSNRIPASACGIVGYKPPFGRNPLDRDHPLANNLHYGPIVRSVADAALMQNVMSGQHPDDICSLADACVVPEALASVEGVRVGLSIDLGYVEVDPEVERNTRASAEALRELGCTLEIVDVGWDWGVLDCFLTWFEGSFAATSADLLPRWRYEMDPAVVRILEKGARHDAGRLYRCNLKRGEMWQKLRPILSRCDVLICPTLAVAALKTDHDEFSDRFTINGQRVEAFNGWSMTYPFSLLSQCPVMSVPTGFTASGMPTGMQIIGRPYDDLRVFEVAAAFEAIKPWRNDRPPV